MYYLSVLGWVLPILIIGAVIYLVAQSRRNGQGRPTAFHALMGYFYFATGASVIISVVGLILVVTLGFGELFDGAWSTQELYPGLTLLAIGALLCLLHVVGRRAAEKQNETVSRTLKRWYLFILLFGFSIAGLISLPAAVIETVRYYYTDDYWGDPAAPIGAAAILVPLWVYYLFRVLRELRTPTTTAGQDQPLPPHD
jgi:hypothetical protein